MMKKILNFLLVGLVLFGCASTPNAENPVNFIDNTVYEAVALDTPIYVEPNPQKGFNYGYYYCIPTGASNKSNAYLMIVSNNWAAGEDRPYKENALMILGGKEAKPIADNLGVVLLVPAIRPQVMMSHELKIKFGKEKRIDLQLIQMMKDARNRVQANNITLKEKVLFNGFSTAGCVGNRFIALHPELVQAVASGGVDAPILPLETYEGKRLNYPVGIADLEKITGTPFNAEAYKAVPQFIFLGDRDDNYGPEDYRLYTYAPVPDAQAHWKKAQTFFNAENSNATFRTYEGEGHNFTVRMMYDIIAFFQGNME